MRKTSLIIIAVLLLIVAGCNGNDDGNDHEDQDSADTTPPVISAVSAQDIAETSAVVTWTTDELATSSVQYGIPDSGDPSVVHEVASVGLLFTSHSVTLGELEPGTVYWFRVRSKDASGNEATSEDKTFTTLTLTDTTPPTVSEVNAVNITESSATIAWTTDELATSHVEYGETTEYGSTTPLDITLLTSHSVALSGLDPDTTYYYRVLSTDASGNESVSDDYTFATASVLAGQLAVHFIDVGQGDAVLVDYGTYELLIDGGGKSPGVTGYLSSYVDGTLDAMVATHMHADHIGGLIAVLDTFDVEEIWHNGDTATSQTYSQFINAVQAEGADVHVARRGDEIVVGELLFDVLNPVDTSGTSNNNSVVLTLSFGEVDFIFTGDAEQEAEGSMVTAGAVPNAEILKVGHHGSRTASSAAFLSAATPEVAIYMAGVGNTYGHPHSETIIALDNIGATIYGTDVHGTVKVITDGTAYDVELTNQVAPVTPSLPADTTPPVISGISDSGVTDSGATISWTTDEVATSQIEYGTDISYGLLTTLDTSLTTAHNVALTELDESTTYHYRVRSKDASGNEAVSDDHSFTTNAAPGPGGVTITDIDLIGEVVTIVNSSSSAVDMTGWRLVSVTGSQPYTFPSFTLAAGATVLIVSGPGSVDNPPTQLRWSGAYIWNNDGDPGELYDASNNLVSSHPGT